MVSEYCRGGYRGSRGIFSKGRSYRYGCFFAFGYEILYFVVGYVAFIGGINGYRGRGC